METGFFPHTGDYLPWKGHTTEELAAQAALQQALRESCGACFGADVFISPLAKLYGVNSLCMGDGSFICADALVREAWLSMGSGCSLNSQSYVQGVVTMGNDVRIAPGAKVIGMNHNAEDPTRPIRTQGLTLKGIALEDDVWIGAGAVVLDGVRVGKSSIIGAGAVVTKDIPPYSIAVGNPARVVRDRCANPPSPPSPTPLTPEALQAFTAMAKAELPGLLAAYGYQGPGTHSMANMPGAEPTTRAWCDAVEIMATLNLLPGGEESDFLKRTIHSLQKPEVDYDVLTVGYALEVLGDRPTVPFTGEQAICQDLTGWLNALPWQNDPWNAGAQIDHLATALYFNQRYFGAEVPMTALFNWLHTQQNPATGLWGGSGDATTDQHLAVNGFYRLTRSTYAAYAEPLPIPEKAVDTLLAQSERPEYFGTANTPKGNACDVLDIIHPLWLGAKQTPHRRAEGEAWAHRQASRILQNWQPGRGFSFEGDKSHPATLQGTEMWLAILWLLCDYIRLSPALGYQPKGVHRPQPVAFL